MKNILKTGPEGNLNARQGASLAFVDQKDITNCTVLDIGCGFGWCEYNFLQRRVGHITGIEISENDLRAAKEGIKDPRADFVVAGATKLPFREESFNTIVCWEVIEHIPVNTEAALFKEAYRVLKPGGVFYLSTPNDHWVATMLDPAWWLVGHRHYSVGMLTKYAQEVGFSVVGSHIKGGIWSTFGILNLYISKWIFHRENFFPVFFSSRETREYNVSDGFANIFIKFQKKKENM